MMKKIGITMLIVANLGVLAIANEIESSKVQKTVEKNTQLKAKLSNEDEKAVNTAISFVNEYIQTDSDKFDKWFANAPVTEKFRKEYEKRQKVIELNEKVLNEKKLTSAEQKFLNENEKEGYEYDPLFGSGILDIKDESKFELKNYDSKTGTVYLKDKYEENFVFNGETHFQGGTEIILKLKKQNNKWLIDEIK